MLHGIVRDVRVTDENPADASKSVEIRVSFITDKAIAPDLLAALAHEPYIALLGDDYMMLHQGMYAERIRKAVEHDQSNGAKLHERIVRCRDCIGLVETWDGWECERFSGEHHRAEPDGFCAWGEIKEKE